MLVKSGPHYLRVNGMGSMSLNWTARSLNMRVSKWMTKSLKRTQEESSLHSASLSRCSCFLHATYEVSGLMEAQLCMRKPVVRESLRLNNRSRKVQVTFI